MLIFHEGLPRSGKSYEAVKKHLVPALTGGRKVYARIDGLNYEQLAGLAGITLERCQELLIHLTKEDVKKLPALEYEIGALLIIDEIQNFYPDSRKNLSEQMTEFISEHGHLGLDIILMGQYFKDMHKLFKNRTSQKVVFSKLEMVGKPDSYRWKLFKATDPLKFVQVTAGTEVYDKAYFGSYKSFEEGAAATQLYKDSRATVWSSAFFKKYLWYFIVLVGLSLAWMIHLFKGGGLEESFTHKQQASKPAPASKAVQPVGTKAAAAPAPPEEKKRYQQDFIQDLSERFRLRVSGIIVSATRQTAMFEWYDDALRVQERLSMLAIARMGYTVVLDRDMETATISKGEVTYVATQFPLESYGRTSDVQQREISGAGDGDVFIIDRRQRRDDHSDVVASADGYGVSRDGWGVLGRAGAGVRVPGSEDKPASR